MYKSPEYLYDVREVKTKDIKSKEWIFKWRKEFAIDGRVLYKLTNADNAIVGMISMEAKQGFVYVHAIERQAKFEGQGVTPYLFTLAALWSDLLGNDAVFSFDAKTRLIPYYERFGAKRLAQTYMIVGELQAKELISKYGATLNLEHFNP